MSETLTVEKPKLGRSAEVPLLIRMKARNLYLTGGLGWVEIGERCGWDPKALATIASREGWTAEKKRRKSLLLQKSDARMAAQASEVCEAIASEAEENALAAMTNVRESLTRSDEFAAKDFQAYTAGVKNLASTARMLREPLSAQAGEGTQITANFFFAPPPPAESQAPKNVHPIEVKQVTD